MTAQPTPNAPPRRLSKSSLISLICGILGCVPFVTGALAVLLGIIGFIRTGNPEKKGRWMAIVGVLLGLASLGGWTLFGSAALLLWQGTEGPRVATHDFVQGISENNSALIAKNNGGISDDQIQNLVTAVQVLGKFKDTTFNNTSISNDTAHVEGTAEFEKMTVNVKADLQRTGGAWKVTEISLKPRT